MVIGFSIVCSSSGDHRERHVLTHSSPTRRSSDRALPFPTGELDSELLFQDRLYVAFPRDDPRDPPEWIAPEMIDETKLLLLEDGHCLKDHALAEIGRAHV